MQYSTHDKVQGIRCHAKHMKCSTVLQQSYIVIKEKKFGAYHPFV